jgi:hypothetical protein
MIHQLANGVLGAALLGWAARPLHTAMTNRRPGMYTLEHEFDSKDGSSDSTHHPAG